MSEKQARIEAFDLYFTDGQLIHFPLAAHGDGPDALAGAVQIIINEQHKSEVLVPRGW